MFTRIPSLIQLIVVEFIAIFCLASGSASLIEARGVLGCPPAGSGLDLSVAIFLLIGLAGSGYLIWRIVWPNSLEQRWRPNVEVGPVILPNPVIPSVRYRFASTHPSYALLELIAIAGPMFLFYKLAELPPAYTGCYITHGYFFGRIGLGLACFFPFLRLISWYALGRRLSNEASRGAWTGVLILFAIALPVYLAILLPIYLPRWTAPHVNEKTFTGGLNAHPEFNGQMVALTGRLKFSEASRCGCSVNDPRSCRAASLLLDLGTGGDVIAHGISSDADTLRVIADRKDIQEGKEFTLYGVLKPLPTTENIDAHPYDWLACGTDLFDPEPTDGRAFLQVEMP